MYVAYNDSKQLMQKELSENLLFFLSLIQLKFIEIEGTIQDLKRNGADMNPVLDLDGFNLFYCILQINISWKQQNQWKSYLISLKIWKLEVIQYFSLLIVTIRLQQDSLNFDTVALIVCFYHNNTSIIILIMYNSTFNCQFSLFTT